MGVTHQTRVINKPAAYVQSIAQYVDIEAHMSAMHQGVLSEKPTRCQLPPEIWTQRRLAEASYFPFKEYVQKS